MTVQTAKGQHIRIRLYGIDCPEGRQPYGYEATETTRSLVLGKQVAIEEVGQDRYRRTVAIVHLPDGTTLQERLLMEGATWVFPPYCTRPECAKWRDLEQAARAEEVGLWHEPEPLPPWEWRSRARNAESREVGIDRFFVKLTLPPVKSF